jgi:uncharacterized protein (DUF433 family)
MVTSTDLTMLVVANDKYNRTICSVPRSAVAFLTRVRMSTPALESVVHSDPNVLGGTPVFTGTTVPLKNLVDYLGAGDPLERFLDHFPSVTREQAVTALKIAADLLAARAHPAR